MTFTSDKRRGGGEVMSDKVTPEAVKAVLDALVGPTAARADTILDEESQANVPKFEAVCDWVFYRLCDADRNYDSPYGSAKATARMVERAAGNLIEPEERVGALPGRRGPWSAGRRVSRVRSDEPGGGPCAAHVGE